MTLVGQTRPAPWDGSFTAVYRDAAGQFFAAHDNTRQPCLIIHPITPQEADSYTQLSTFKILTP